MTLDISKGQGAPPNFVFGRGPRPVLISVLTPAWNRMESMGTFITFKRYLCYFSMIHAVKFLEIM